jgi:hypothetical protein
VGTPFTVEIPYDQLMLLVMGLFMFVGATRGMHREAITTVGLVVLAALLVEPGLAGPIIGYLSNLVRLLVAFFVSHFSVNPKVLLDTYANITVPFTADNPYAFLIFALVGFVLLSYTSRGSQNATALSRLLGGLLGLFNGFLVISLFKEYIVKYIQTRSPTVAVAGPPAQVSVALKGLPLAGPLTGGSLQFVVVILGALAALLILSSVFGMSLQADKKDKKG